MTVAVVLVYLALAVLLYWPVWSNHPASRTPLGGDQWLSTWFLAWVPKAIGNGHNPLFSNYANYPGGVNLLSNTGLTFLGILGSPITVLFGPVATTNVLLTAGPALSATSAYALIRRFTMWRPSAFVGGLLYGFGPFVILHAYIHINFTFNCLPPLIFLVLYELVARQPSTVPPMRWGLLLGALLVVQFFISSEVMATTIVVGAFAVAVAAVVGRRFLREKVEYAAKGLAWAAVCAGALLAYPVWFLLWGPAHIVGPIQLTPQAYRADLFGLFVPTRAQLIAPRSLQHISRDFADGENGSYLGLPLLVVAAVGVVWLRHRAVVVVAAVTAAIAFVLSLGGALAVSALPASNSQGDAVGRIPLPEALVAKLPLLRNIIPSRFAMYVALFIGIVIACIIDHLWSTLNARPGRWKYAAPAAVALVSLVPLIPAASPIAVGYLNAPKYYSSKAVEKIPRDSVALVYPFPSGTWSAGAVWQAVADFRFKMPGGYFRVPQPPTGHIAFSPLLGYTEDTKTAETLVALANGNAPARTPALKDLLLAQLASWNVQSAIATPSLSTNPRESLAFLTWLLGEPSLRHGATYVWYSL